MALWISWQFFLAGIAVAIILWLGVSRFMKMARRAGRTKTKQTLLLTKTITDTLTNIKALKAMNRQGFIAQTFRHHVDALRNALAAESYSESMVRAIQEPIFFIFIMGGMYLQHTLFNMSIQQILGSILVLRGLAGAIGTVRGSMQRVLVDSSAFWSLVGLIEEMEGVAEQLHGGTAPRFDAGISFDRVNFGYGQKRVLTDVSIEMLPHTVTSVIGPSGVGKTTIADLLVGLNKPDSGRVLVAGVDLEAIDTVAWRKQIGYIPQDTVLFNQSVAKNVTLGDESIDLDKVIAALKAADAWDFVQALPGGVDYVVGVRGSLLSGGQRQRLSIARALCNTPQLLILDEATSALDRETAIEIANGIRNLIGEKTVLAISHQSIWVDAADRVYEMQKGTLKVADGQPLQ
jgi:ATP-binding cassette subfamily C protein